MQEKGSMDGWMHERKREAGQRMDGERDSGDRREGEQGQDISAVEWTAADHAVLAWELLKNTSLRRSCRGGKKVESMKVHELIAKLQECGPGCEVWVDVIPLGTDGEKDTQAYVIYDWHECVRVDDQAKSSGQPDGPVILNCACEQLGEG